ncbi:hypothetical protein VTI74DRAFT_1518 [Chaetomium olivicolor]
MQSHLYRRQYLSSHHRPVTAVVALLSSFAPRAIGVGGIGGPELEDRRCMHKNRRHQHPSRKTRILRVGQAHQRLRHG